MENNKQILFGDEAIERYNILKEKGLILYECIIGSHSYGLNIETSDIDEVFIYIEDIDNILADNCSIQLNITDDYKGYEIWRYLELLSKQNPVTIEYLFTNEKFVKFCHPLFKELLVNHGDEFLSKKVAFSFGAYAKTQICKAQGANKKFMNPMPGPRKSLLEFAYVPYNEGSITLEEYLEINDIPHNWIGLSAIDHMKYTYNLYIDPIYYKHLFLGIDKLYIKKFINEKWPDYKSIYNGPVDIDGVQPKLSSIPKGEKSEVIVQFNLDAFQKYCKEYKEYHEWLEKRNLQRFVENADNEHQFDRKNSLHCIRLLNMCCEILRGEGVKVYRQDIDREYLLGIRYGKSTYKEIFDLLNSKLEEINELVKTSPLPDEIDKKMIKEIILKFRKQFYQINN